MKEISLEVPSWIEKTEARKMFFRNLCNEAKMKVEYYRSLMKPFEHEWQYQQAERQKILNAVRARRNNDEK